MYSFYRHQIVGRKLNNAIKIDFGVILHLWVVDCKFVQKFGLNLQSTTYYILIY